MKIIFILILGFFFTILLYCSCKKNKNDPSAQQLVFIGKWSGQYSCNGHIDTTSIVFLQGNMGGLSIATYTAYASSCPDISKLMYGTILNDSLYFPKEKFIDGCGVPVYESANGLLSGSNLIFVDTILGGVYKDSEVCIYTLTKQ